MNTNTIVKATAKIGGESLYINFINGDETVLGGIAGINQNVFKIDDIDIKENDIILDIGSNVGIISLYLAKKYPQSILHAFDPCKEAIDCLRTSLIDNKLYNIITHNFAVGASNSFLEFSFEKDHFSCLQENKFDNPQTQERRIYKKMPQVKIDEIFDSYIFNISRVKYLKIDIEGSEVEVFEHLIENRIDILDRIDYINLEFHHHPQIEGTTNRILKIKEFLVQKFENRVIFQDAFL